jgi:hypothetical protein
MCTSLTSQLGHHDLESRLDDCVASSSLGTCMVCAYHTPACTSSLAACIFLTSLHFLPNLHLSQTAGACQPGTGAHRACPGSGGAGLDRQDLHSVCQVSSEGCRSGDGCVSTGCRSPDRCVTIGGCSLPDTQCLPGEQVGHMYLSIGHLTLGHLIGGSAGMSTSTQCSPGELGRVQVPWLRSPDTWVSRQGTRHLSDYSDHNPLV